MQGRTHLVGGLVAAGAYALNGPPSTIAPSLVLLAGAFGGLLPDIDEPRSKLGSCVPGVSHVLKRTVGHRGLTHSFLGLTLVALGAAGILDAFHDTHLLTLIDNLYFRAFLLGYASHLVLDAFAGGVPVFWPVKTRFGGQFVKTGGAFETWVLMPVGILIGISQVTTVFPSLTATMIASVAA